LTQEPNGTELEQDQAALDAEQTPTQATTVTTGEIEDLKRIIETQSSQIAGLQSKIDTGLNAIRRDAETRIAQERSERETEAALEQLPIEQQQVMRPILERNRELESQQMTSQAGQEEQVAPTTIPTSDPGWDRVRAHVQTFGISPDDSRVNYGIFAQAGKDQQSLVTEFNQHLIQLTTQSAPSQTPAAPQNNSVSPPVGSAPPAGAGSGRMTTSDARKKWLEGGITTQQRDEIYRRNGETVR
jgi:hypothetical protein